MRCSLFSPIMIKQHKKRVPVLARPQDQQSDSGEERELDMPDVEYDVVKIP